MPISKRVMFITAILITITSLMFYTDIQQNALHFINLLNTSRSSTLQLYRAFRDLSADFETDSAYVANHLSVFEALKRDGYKPVAVSEVLVHISPPPSEYKIQCFTTSPPVKQVTSAPHNLSDVVSNRSINTNSTNVQSINTKSTNVQCLQVKVQENSTKAFRVPNVVHYVFLGSDLTFTFSNYLSYRSVDRFIKPNQIFVHGDHIPSGKWWNRTIDEVKNIYHVKRTYTNKAPNGQPYKFMAHISDYMRAETLLSYGGIYIDADVLIVKSFNPLRQFPFVIGREDPGALCNGIMIAEKGAPFLRLMLEQYRSYLGPREIWAVKSVVNTDTLASLYPHLVHVEETTLDRPNWRERAQIYDGRYNWTKNFAVHLWIRMWPAEKRPNGFADIMKKNTTFGELARLAIFGSHEIRKNATNVTSH